MLARILLILAAVLASAAQAQPATYPSRPLRLIVADNPGSITDTRARQVGARLGEQLGQPVVIENRPGGSMAIAAEVAARAPADGYTLLLGNVVTHSLNPQLIKGLAYRPAEDFVPVTMLSAGPLVMVVHPSVAARTLEELLALALAQPGALNYAAIGQGSPGHVLMEQVKAMRGARFELVAYKATSQYIQDLLAGRLQVSLNFWPVLGPQVKAGKLRALAVAGPRRLEAAPDVPTFEEAGLPGIEGSAWQGIFVPVGTPRAIVGRLHAEIARALQAPEIRSAIVDGGSEVGGMPPEEFAAYVRADFARWQKAVSDAGMQPQ